MLKPVGAFLSSRTNKLYLDEVGGTKEEVMADLLHILPELTMIRERVWGNLDAIAQAVGPILALNARVPSEPEGPIDHGELAGTCDCAAGMNGSPRHHHRTCPSYNPVAIRA